MKMAKDPICGMMVDEKKAKFKSDYKGKTYYFCAPSCKATFDKSQQNTLAAQLQRDTAAIAAMTTAKP